MTTVNIDPNSENMSEANLVIFNKDKTLLLTYIAGKPETSYTIPGTVKSIASGAFTGAKNLTEISIPNSVTTIGANAFQNCSGLLNITLPDAVTSITIDIFSGCTSLASITVSPNHPTYSTKDGVLYDKIKTELIYYPLGKTDTALTIPEGVVTVAASAFTSHTYLVEVTVASTVRTISASAFSSMTKLTTIIFEKGSELRTIGSSAFNYSPLLANIAIPDGTASIGDYAFAGCTSITELYIPLSVNSVGWYCFMSWTAQQTIYFIGRATYPSWTFWNLMCSANIVLLG